MAERYGGKYSPGGNSPSKGARPAQRSRIGLRVNLLFVLPFVFLIPAFTGPPADLAFYLAAFAALELAAWLTREGQIAHEAYDARAIAKRPAIPRKLFASALTALGLGIAGYAGDSTLTAIIFAVLGGVLHLMSFGPDPLTDKGAPDGDAFQTERVARAVEDAERRIEEMTAAIRHAGIPSLTRRVEGFGQTAHGMLRAIEEDPRDLTGAKKYIGVYLTGARDATIQFADLYARSQNAEAREDYEALLDDLEGSFQARTRKMIDNDKANLDVEIEVLRERLAREGVSRPNGQQ